MSLIIPQTKTSNRTEKRLKCRDIWRFSRCCHAKNKEYIGANDFTKILTVIIESVVEEILTLKTTRLPHIGAFRVVKSRRSKLQESKLKEAIQLRNPNAHVFKTDRRESSGYLAYIKWDHTTSKVPTRNYWNFRVQRSLSRYLIRKSIASTDFIDQII